MAGVTGIMVTAGTDITVAGATASPMGTGASAGMPAAASAAVMVVAEATGVE
jgi:hypothetical protein